MACVSIATDSKYLMSEVTGSLFSALMGDRVRFPATSVVPCRAGPVGQFLRFYEVIEASSSIPVQALRVPPSQIHLSSISAIAQNVQITSHLLSVIMGGASREGMYIRDSSRAPSFIPINEKLTKVKAERSSLSKRQKKRKRSLTRMI